jgi:hypothetical protein
MATKSMSYDHPQYTVNQIAGGILILLTADVRKTAYTAFADSVVRAVHINKLVAGTNTAATAVGNFLGVHYGAGAALATDTLAVAGDFGTSLAGTSVSVTTTLTRGQTYVVSNAGTDAGAQFGIGIEVRPVPGASVEA